MRTHVLYTWDIFHEITALIVIVNKQNLDKQNLVGYYVFKLTVHSSKFLGEYISYERSKR